MQRRPGQPMTSRRQPLVSVVTPVYNGEKCLRACIESVLAQTHTNWNYTIVNNCSTDRTLDVAHEYAARDSRIRVRSNDTFARVTRSYNNAVRQISDDSAYCKVVAADDWLAPDCLEQMVGLAEEHPSVAIVGAYGLRGTRVLWTGLPYPSTVVVGRDLCRQRLLGGPYVFGTPTAVLYRSCLVRDRPVFYNESNLHGDSEVCFELLEHHDFGFVHQVLSFQGEQSDSLTSFSEMIQTYRPWILYELVKFGPKYLTADELSKRITKHLGDYYRYLGWQVYKRRGSDFWKFHREKLAAVGYPLSRSRLAGAMASYALDALLNPKSAAERLVNRILPGDDGDR